jgi:hypothetical protein
MKNKYLSIYLLAFASGFLSLALEVVWMRIVSFAGHSVPQAFSYTLALFLTGIAIGAWQGRKICRERRIFVNHELIGQYFGYAGCVDLVVLLVTYMSLFISNQSILAVAAIGILITTSVRGVVFPLVHHLGTEKTKSGRQISNVYFSNVVGSSLSPILIGFVLLDIFNTQQIYFAICVCSFLIAAWCTPSSKKLLFYSQIGLLICTLGLLWLPEKLFQALAKDVVGKNIYPITLIENKHGIIQVYDTDGTKVVYGANVYDGKFNIDFFNQNNRIDRAYFVPIMKPDAKNILVIGLSTGSWTRVLSMMPKLEKMTIVEINPDYVKEIAKHPEIAPLLQDERVNIIIDDGRKWVRKNVGQYDVIMMNTTYYWRAYGTNLLSQEFLNILKQHLHTNSMVLYNPTGSEDAFFTAKSVYPQVYDYNDMVVSSFQPIDKPNVDEIAQRLMNLQFPENQQVVFSAEQAKKAAEFFDKQPFHVYKHKENERLPEIIHDSNMITEYKYGKGLFSY